MKRNSAFNSQMLLLFSAALNMFGVAENPATVLARIDAGLAVVTVLAAFWTCTWDEHLYVQEIPAYQ